MKRSVKRILILVPVIIIVLIGGLLAYVKTALPDVGPAPDIKVAGTPEQIARGRYLTNHVALCLECHSTRDFNVFSGPVIAGTEGKGGEVFDQAFGFPGKYVSANITPAGISSWTDGELFRAITAGVSKDGRPLFPIMPYPHFGTLDSNDILSIIAYIRTIPALENAVEKSSSDFPMNFIIHTIPAKAEFTRLPDRANRVAYGKYLATAASCESCHTKFEKGKFIGEPYAGGREFPFPDGSMLRSANLTPHATGSGDWTEAMFIQKFKQYTDSTYVPRTPKEMGFQTMMPWTSFAHMTEEDLGAIYAYLQSLTPVENVVVKFAQMKKE